MEEKVKLISLNESQWHYKLIKFVFRNSMPDPKTIKNLCPYFWILVASLFLVIPILPIRIIQGIGNLVMKGLEKYADSRFHNWIASLDVDSAFDLYAWNDEEHIKRTKKSKKYSDRHLLEQWAAIRGLNINDPDYDKKLHAIFEKTRDERNKEYEKSRAESAKRYAVDAERKRIARERRERYQERMNKFGKLFDPTKKMFSNIGNSFKFENYNQIIKATKRFVGILITVGIALGLSYCAQLLTAIALIIVAAWNTAAVLGALWVAVKFIGIALGCALPVGGAIYGIYLLILRAVQSWEKKKRIPWYAIPFVQLGKLIWFLGEYLIYIPGYFLFVSVIWNLICVSILYSAGKALCIAFMKFGGIFGEYFGSSYSDYCPGLNWEQTEEQK